MRFISSILKNPLTLWLYWLVQKTFLEITYWTSNLQLGYLTNIKSSTFGQYNKLYDHVRLWHSSIGSYTYIAKNSQISRSHIGKFCAIGPNVQMGLGTHPTSTFVSIHPAFYSVAKQVGSTFSANDFFTEHATINIGNDVWIGANVIVADGVSIGDGAIIAAGAVVTKNVAAYQVVGGVPAKFIRYRFTESEISFLLNFRWWDKNKEWLAENAALMLDIQKLKQKYDITD